MIRRAQSQSAFAKAEAGQGKQRVCVRDQLRFSLSERDKGTYVRDSLVALPEPSMRPSDSSTFILFVYMYFLASSCSLGEDLTSWWSCLCGMRTRHLLENSTNKVSD